ncbi:MAG: hypothetical protein KGD74_00500 [Candidatus Lokiarchaeota archaeon]|nr:hypothetical protein [Candidatus Lokiarchaeota archaeon]
MCYYITATLPKDTKLDSLKPFLGKFDMDFSLLKNTNITSQLRPDEIYLRATKSYCDCNTTLGSRSITPEYNKMLKSQKVRGLRKKRWTDEQIHLWILEKINNKKPKGHENLTLIEKDIEINNWINFLTQLLGKNKLTRVGILKHWYSKGLSNEDFLIKNTEHISVKELNSGMLLNLEDDVLYEFYPFS